MVADMADRSSGDSVHLVYLNATPDFLFRADFEHGQEQLESLSIDFLTRET